MRQTEGYGVLERKRSVPDRRYAVRQLGVGLTHVDNFRGNVAEYPQSDDPVQDFVVSRVLYLLRSKFRQLAPLTCPHQFQIASIGLDVYRTALELVGQETV